MPRNISKIKRQVTFLDQGVIDEVSAEIQGGSNVVAYIITVAGVQSFRHQAPLDLPSGYLISLQNTQMLTQTAVRLLELVPVTLVLQDKITMVQGFTYRMNQHFHIHDGLDEVIAGTQTQRRNHVIYYAGAGDDNNGKIGESFMELQQNLQTIKVGHAEVSYDQIGKTLINGSNAGIAIRDLSDLKATVFEVRCDTLTNKSIVINDEQFSTSVCHP